MSFTDLTVYAPSPSSRDEIVAFLDSTEKAGRMWVGFERDDASLVEDDTSARLRLSPDCFSSIYRLNQRRFSKKPPSSVDASLHALSFAAACHFPTKLDCEYIELATLGDHLVVSFHEPSNKAKEFDRYPCIYSIDQAAREVLLPHAIANFGSYPFNDKPQFRSLVRPELAELNQPVCSFERRKEGVLLEDLLAHGRASLGQVGYAQTPIVLALKAGFFKEPPMPLDLELVQLAPEDNLQENVLKLALKHGAPLDWTQKLYQRLEDQLSSDQLEKLMQYELPRDQMVLIPLFPYTPIHAALMKGDEAAAKWLLEKPGISFDPQLNGGANLIAAAAENPQISLQFFKMLLEKAKETLRGEDYQALAKGSAFSSSPLSAACQCSWKEARDSGFKKALALLEMECASPSDVVDAVAGTIVTPMSSFDGIHATVDSSEIQVSDLRLQLIQVAVTEIVKELQSLAETSNEEAEEKAKGLLSKLESLLIKAHRHQDFFWLNEFAPVLEHLTSSERIVIFPFGYYRDLQLASKSLTDRQQMQAAEQVLANEKFKGALG